ncbi:MAG: NAD(+) synthetase [candidate division Zixibacteria bacterium RBG_16_53_22]|nr:MAG: NAD(+) synthetase [candidate division Zixibacteria bacterium RBG_16_53_22]
MPGQPQLDLDYENTLGLLTTFIRDELAKPGFSRLIIGLSGGLDSAVVAYLSVKAIGSGDVVAVILPYKESGPDNIRDARKMADDLGLKKYEIDITPQIDGYFQKFPEADLNRRGNKMARERMSILYDLSAVEKALVIGTSNKTEILLGYGTLFGDLGYAMNPLGDLYKTQVRILARHLGVPENIIAKKPSADLFAGQSDEGDFGFSYDDVDRLLYLLVDERFTPEQCEKAGFGRLLIDKVIKMIVTSQFKRSTPIIAKLSNRTVGIDFRYPRDWGK